MISPRMAQIILKCDTKCEGMLFWIPGYNGAVLDFFLLLNRKQTSHLTVLTNDDRLRSMKTRVYICTTMYREDEGEMKQLLESLSKVNVAQQEGETFFQSHIFFDGGVNNNKLSEFPLVLISLLEETLGIKPEHCTKDNKLVKNKKRWSQVMYMSYVLDFLKVSRSCLCKDTSNGSGPLVWYQVFEYAVGHWFQKASEHVLGSVLCAPGCFSVYRCRALSDVLPKYCKKVESAFDFLTKDMGEDRWLCTLMLQSGWRIEYCAASENSTNCPAEFEEFYKQRRRWIASTLANLMLIIKEWKYIALFNHRLTVVFLSYQALLLFSTLIAPSMVILVVSGGLQYAWDINVSSIVILQVILCIIYTLVCLYTSQDTQMLVSKIFTFFYAVVMCAAAVGTAEQVVMDFSDYSTSELSPNGTKGLLFETTTKKPSQHISINLPVSVTTIYLAFLVGIFILGGILHPREFTCLLHGIWYLLCLPSAYLVLILYSICNLTDSSWGTREEIKVTVGFKTNWWSKVYKKFKKIFFCCQDKKVVVSIGVQTQMSLFRQASGLSSMCDEGSKFSGHQNFVDGQFHSEEYLSSIDDVDFDVRFPIVENQILEVDQWLPQELNVIYSDIFKKHGYENTLFIKGLTESDLLQMGVQRKGHVQFILSQISNLPAFEIEYKVPNDVDDWLNEIGLLMYKEKFHKNKIKTLKEMEILKSFNDKTIADQLEIKKQGHIKRLLYAIRMLRDPTEAQKKAFRIRQLLDDLDLQDMKICNIEEFAFWDNLKSKCLEPDLKAFGMDADIKVKLVGLRNNWLMTTAIANTLWLILLSTIAMKGNLTVIGANPIGLVFLFIFGLLFLIQFLAMIIHRLSTLCHYIARAPYTFGNPLLTNWSFHDKFDNHILFTCDEVEVNDRYLPNERTPLL
ncbi:Chitin synthase, class 2 [Bulinus truncatus]|nr:Chitin synthase, class 2 [Bulinus truncatus]